MKRATSVDSALPPHFDPVPARVRWSEARAAGWSPFKHRLKATVDLSCKGPPCAY
ncbi:hypothetical protein X743_24305 [Mesorhizobium sp. LNHC252B00]|nr:hypothetical protein X743_24305 [Mesorhizobium sp. LNHC252B00]